MDVRSLNGCSFGTILVFLGYFDMGFFFWSELWIVFEGQQKVMNRLTNVHDQTKRRECEGDFD